MKEQIKQIIKQWVEKEKSNQSIDRTDEERYDDLATRLDKAIGIDEDAVERIVFDSVLKADCDHQIIGCKTCSSAIARSIARSRPLKCEVDA